MSQYFIDTFKQGVPPPPGLGGVSWREIGRVTLGGTDDNLTVSGLEEAEYLEFICHIIPNGAVNKQLTFNGDVSANYSSRVSNNGGGGIQGTNAIAIGTGTGTNANDEWIHGYIHNRKNSEKMMHSWPINRNSVGSGVAPNRSEIVGKWDNVVDSINQIAITTTGGDYDIGSELIILAWDPRFTEDDSDNFWKFLGRTSASGGETNLDVIVTAKKYYWLRAFASPGVGTSGFVIRTGIGSIDASANYSTRINSINIENTFVNLGAWFLDNGANQENAQKNAYIVNVDGREKLSIGHTVNDFASITVPIRQELAEKYDITAGLLDRFQLIRTSGVGTLDSDSFIEVWGSD